ncbi:hypothetical protein B6U99_02430 [Candidatus Geothermarchaeota archaeon ex4572_27]|nr:MAG: hypothetical protein B6U99_02430 [Candidatus Geothermarchaeota archaeon ex4572_27]
MRPVIENLVARAVIAGTALMIAAMGEVITERSGVLNLGIEGAFVFACAAAFAATVLTGSPLAGLAAGCAVGALIGALHGLISVSLRGYQVVSGLALTLFGYGAASLAGKGFVGAPLPAVITAEGAWWALLAAEIAAAAMLWHMLFRLKIGSVIRAAGEDPYSAETLGVNVVKVRMVATVVGSAMVGLGGAWYTLGYLHIWTEGLGMGRGWISLAIVIVSGWNPLYLFGGVEAAIWRLQLPPYNMDPYLLGMVPYVVTLLALTAFMATPLRRTFKPPAALGITYHKEERTV